MCRIINSTKKFHGFGSKEILNAPGSSDPPGGLLMYQEQGGTGLLAFLLMI